MTKFIIIIKISTDRKSTRLNSSHANISYAVFCLKKKQHKCQGGRSCRGRPRRRPAGSPSCRRGLWSRDVIEVVFCFVVFFAQGVVIFFFIDGATPGISLFSQHGVLPV